ncbi:methyltransferase domain-containing protein [Terasakiella pusilla]|uniref:methyltransferase domain-containing protein n=1 Tax=Terasakiella pusilla TaxID=64973 RepID=UPI003AA83CB2
MVEQTVLCVVGARLNSSRLPKKHLLDLEGKPLLQCLLERLKTSSLIDDIVVATTRDAFNQSLVDLCEKIAQPVFAYEGDVNNLVDRVDTVVRRHKPDFVLYVCGDCPLVDVETIDAMISKALETPKVQVVELMPLPDGKSYIHEGFDLFSAAFWREMSENSIAPFNQEHIASIYRHSGVVKPTHVEYVELDQLYSAIEHRISVDTLADYDFMRAVYKKWYRQHGPETIVDFKWAISLLQDDPAYLAINSHVRQRKAAEKGRSVLFVTQAGAEVGFGHLSRTLTCAKAAQEYNSYGVKVLVEGKPISFSRLDLFNARWIESLQDATDVSADIICLDLKNITDEHIAWAREHASYVVCLNQYVEGLEPADLYWFPSPYVQAELASREEVKFGWDCMLVDQSIPALKVAGLKKRGVVLTGSGDHAKMGATLAQRLATDFGAQVELDWVQGPFADAPVFTQEQPDGWRVLTQVQGLSNHLQAYDFAICVFGVSFFECLGAGVPAVCIDPLHMAKPEEWQLLKNAMPPLMAESQDDVCLKLNKLLENQCDKEFLEPYQMDIVKGPAHFAASLRALIPVSWQDAFYGEHSGKLVYQHVHGDVIECEQCGFKHMIPLPSYEQLKTFYEEEFYQAEKEDYLQKSVDEWLWLDFEFGDRLARAEQSLGSHSERTVLDIGTGPGGFLQVAKARNWIGLGIEPSDHAASFARQNGLEVHTGFFDAEWAAQMGQFDLVHMSEVLEHVPEPSKLLNLAVSKVKPGGMIVVSVPNDFNPLQEAVIRQDNAESWWVVPDHHLNYFDFESLENLLRHAGLNIVNRSTNFPMEMFLLMGENYRGASDIGKKCHKRRMTFDISLGQRKPEARRALYESLASAGLGRLAIVYAQKPMEQG